jgi:PAS domain S-box-containing protein
MTGIFLVDMVSSLHIAIAALYILVLLMSSTVFPNKVIIVLSIGCILLTVTAFFIAHLYPHSPHQTSALARCTVSIIAIIATTLIITRSKNKVLGLSDQIRILEQTHDAIIVRDMEYRITHWNQGASSLLGWSHDEVIGKKCYELLCTVRRPSLTHVAQEIQSTGRWEGEEIYHHKNGTTVYVTSRWSLQRDARGKPKALISASNDITAVRQAEEALAQSQAQLAHVMRVTMLGELAASVAHEINQPLAAIAAHGSASLRWLDRDPPDLKEVTSGLKEITRDAERASQVIKRIRALSKKSDAAYTTLNIRGVVEEALSLVERELQGKKIALIRALLTTKILVRGDKIQLQQVIINLVINAAQAINGHAEGRRAITVSTCEAVAGFITVTVSDTGPGLAEETRPQLFEAFFTTKHEGMGLGLSICRSIVESHGGKIYAENNAQGADVKFLLPTVASI